MPVFNPSYYTAPQGFSVEGGRVGLVSCRRCGCAIFLTSESIVSPIDVHDSWHRSISEKTDPRAFGWKDPHAIG